MELVLIVMVVWWRSLVVVVVGGGSGCGDCWRWWGVRGGGGDDGVVGVVNLIEMVVDFGRGREVVVVGFVEIRSSGWLVEVEGGGGVERGVGEWMAGGYGGTAVTVVMVEATVVKNGWFCFLVEGS